MVWKITFTTLGDSLGFYYLCSNFVQILFLNKVYVFHFSEGLLTLFGDTISK